MERFVVSLSPVELFPALRARLGDDHFFAAFSAESRMLIRFFDSDNGYHVFCGDLEEAADGTVLWGEFRFFSPGQWADACEGRERPALSEALAHPVEHLYRSGNRKRFRTMLDSLTEEHWDVYDNTLCPTGRVFYKGAALQPGEYARMVHILIRRPDGLWLLQQRAFSKKFYPGMWDATCGKVQAGEDGLSAAVREVEEELGLKTAPEEYRLLYHSLYERTLVLDVFLLEKDCSEKTLTLQADEVAAVRFCTLEEAETILKPNKGRAYMDILASFHE